MEKTPNKSGAAAIFLGIVIGSFVLGFFIEAYKTPSSGRGQRPLALPVI